MTYHNPVLLRESIEGLAIKPDGIYVDATFGGGGHSAEIIKNLKSGKLFAFDQDKDAAANKINDPRFVFIHGNFRFLKNFMKFYNVPAIDGILADLGISSHQIDESERGFTIRGEAPLDLRMNREGAVNAQQILATYSSEELSRIFFEYSELRDSRKIANAIVQFRSTRKIETMNDLAEAIGWFAEKGKENKFYAKVLQALRIEINQELDALKELLQQASELLAKQGRMVIISYHSLEDRLVKNFIRTGNFEGEVSSDFYGNRKKGFREITRKPVIPSDEEIENNSRARSAKMRIAEKI